MAAIGQRMRLRLFLEGVEVPVIAAQVQVNPNSPAVCSLQLPPFSEGTYLLPRTLVHLFFLDFYALQSPFTTAPAGTTSQGTNNSPTAQQNKNTQAVTNSLTGGSVDALNANYKLLFGGEVVGWAWTKSQNNRSLVLQCQDWSNYWDYAQQWNNTDIFGPGIKAMFSGGSTNLFTDFLTDEGSALIQIIMAQSCISHPNLKGLLCGIVNLLEKIGGTYYYPTTIKGTNLFYSLAELRLHITQMITAYDADPTAAQLLSKGYDMLLGRTLGGLGAQVSIRQAINALMTAIFHETYAQCCPSYVPGSGGAFGTGASYGLVKNDPNNSYISTAATGLRWSIARLTNMLSSPPEDIEALLSNAQTMQQQLASMAKICADTATKISRSPASVQPAAAYYSSALTQFQTAQSAAKKWQPGTQSTSAANAAQSSLVSTMNSALLAADAQLAKAENFTEVGSSTPTAPARLNSQIFRPDVWFSAPPTCNVLFPDMYHTLNYQRMFLTEPTRLLLKTNDEFMGEDELFDKFYFAPKGYTVNTSISKQNTQVMDMCNGGIMDHELFKGILPVFEKMGELNIFGARSGTFTMGGAPKISLAQRTANFLYFKYYFASRQLTVQARFNPYLACGFPALIIDKYVNPDMINQRNQQILQNSGVVTDQINKLLGTHFLANLTEVSHSVSQSDGSTSINCGFARQPEEGIEFLGVEQPGTVVQQPSPVPAQRTSVVAAVVTNPPSVGGTGPNKGTIISVTDVTGAYANQSVTLYSDPNSTGSGAAPSSVMVGLLQPAYEYGLDVVAYIGDTEQVVEFGAYSIVESITQYTGQIVQLPMEEYIRPGWYGDCWHPLLIGQAYQQFFSCGSITDQQSVQLGDGSVSSLGGSYAAAQQALAQAAKATSSSDPAANAPGLLALDKNASIQAAVAFIVSTYSTAKTSGASIDDFISSYTWRPIATMIDMFGTSDLTLDSTGQNVVSGTEGFHSRAFGNYSNLFGLVSPAITSMLGITAGSTTAQNADTRARKQQAVLAYVYAAQASRAAIG